MCEVEKTFISFGWSGLEDFWLLRGLDKRVLVCIYKKQLYVIDGE
jgi:hypothetical protein